MKNFKIFDGTEPEPETKHYEYASDKLDFFSFNLNGQFAIGSTPREDSKPFNLKVRLAV